MAVEHEDHEAAARQGLAVPLARARLLRLSRALRVAPLPASRGPAPAVHACPRQRLGLGRSALVGDALAPQARLQAARGTSIARPFGRL